MKQITILISLILGVSPLLSQSKQIRLFDKGFCLNISLPVDLCAEHITAVPLINRGYRDKEVTGGSQFLINACADWRDTSFYYSNIYVMYYDTFPDFVRNLHTSFRDTITSKFYSIPNPITINPDGSRTTTTGDELEILEEIYGANCLFEEGVKYVQTVKTFWMEDKTVYIQFFMETPFCLVNKPGGKKLSTTEFIETVKKTTLYKNRRKKFVGVESD